MYFIYVFYLKASPPHFPPTVYLLPTPPVYKIKTKTVHSSQFNLSQ